jgi:hypothetical protein
MVVLISSSYLLFCILLNLAKQVLKNIKKVHILSPVSLPLNGLIYLLDQLNDLLGLSTVYAVERVTTISERAFDPWLIRTISLYD